MPGESSSYKSIVKSTAVFGGSQVVQMLITILRSKLIAVFLGSHGMGINAIFQSTIAVISSFSSLGIFQSAVRDISQAHQSGDNRKLSKIIVVFKRVVWFTACLGMCVCLFGSFWLSKIAFESDAYTIHFALLSLALVFTALSNGEVAFLQGTRNLTYLAKASMFGAAISLLAVIPLYYFLGAKGIVFAIIAGSLSLFLTQYYFTRKIKLEKTGNLSIAQTITEGKPMVKLGSVLMFSTVMMTMFTYLTNIYIGRYGQVQDVGLFQGVSSITLQSIAVVIAVLASDFFPRLAAVHEDHDKVKLMVNQQSELISLIIAPIMVMLIVFAPVIIAILLSAEFSIVTPMLRWMSLSLLVRGIWLTMSYIILAKGDTRAYFVYDALIGNGLLFIFNILAYTFWGLQGIGISFFVGSVMVALVLYLVVRVKYRFSFNQEFAKTFGILTAVVFSSFIVIILFNGWLQYLLSASLMILTFTYSYQTLNRRIGIMQIIKARFPSSIPK